MPRYTDLGSVPGAWRDSSIAIAASNAFRSHGYYDSGRDGPSASSLPSNASGSVTAYVSSSTSSAYDSLRAQGEHISRALVNGTATRAEVEAYNAKAREFATRNPAPPGT